MGIDGVDAGNVQSINDALVNTTNTLTTAASVQEMVDSYNHILDLRDVGRWFDNCSRCRGLY
jgi:hypothetical protein